ncbi:MAG TPA: histidine kinase N-terminal 7TM domain-containing protein, partial [Rectinemataceae bacterium]|nr:histidine kinase N-terminal 7TM domain-containing protein [Rectinemataceae bacterium]
MSIFLLDYGPILIGCSVTLLVLATLVAFSLPGRSNPYSSIILVGTALWSLFHGLEIGAADQGLKELWSDLQYLGLGLLPFSWVAFTARVAGDRKPRLVARLWPYLLFTAFEVLAAATNRWTGALFGYSGIQGMGQQADKHRGWAFWLCTALLLFSMGRGSLTLFRASRNEGLDGSGRRRARLFLLVVILPLLLGILDVLNIRPIPGYNFAPLSLSVSIIILGYGLFFLRLLSPIPLAHRALIDGMKDPVIVVDERRWAVYRNAAAAAIARSGEWSRHGAPLDRFLPEISTPEDIADGSVLRIGEREYEVRSSPVTKKDGAVTVRLFVLRDVTASRAERERLEEIVRGRAVQLRDANL